MTWIEPGEVRVGLGCMRLPEDAFAATVAAAAQAGITIFDTAGAYDRGANERRLARALRACGAAGRARIVTKGGMTRRDEAWVPDGRARTIQSHCEASLEALDGLPIAAYLLHAPDPRTPWATSVRALARLVHSGLVSRVGVCNVTRDQLEEALALAPISTVQVALSPGHDAALRGGLVARCTELGITLMAHSPLGGPRQAGRLARSADLAAIADSHGVAAAEVALAWLLSLSPSLVAIPGATRPQTARGAARAARLVLDGAERARLTPARPAAPRTGREGGDVVLIMGIPGAGKTRLAESFVARGYLRLNRDERGGRLGDIADALDRELGGGRRHVVLDNTYLTRALRSYVVDAAARHGAGVRCLWVNTPLEQAQVNLVARLVRTYGALPEPEALRRGVPGVMAPTSQMRALRALEAPAAQEGFASVEEIAPARDPATGAAGVFVAATALQTAAWERLLATGLPHAPHLVFDWRPGAPADALDEAAERIAAVVSGPIDAVVCPHGAGPPRCWCRPPLPGLPIAFAHAHDLDPARCILVGTSTAHRTLAGALGARFVAAVG